MKLRSTLILLFLAVGLFAYIWFVDKKQPTTRESLEKGKRVAQVERDKVNAISIKNAEAKIELRKKDNDVWYLEEPVKDRADSMAVNQLFTTAETLNYDAVIGDDSKGAEKEQVKEFGLANSEVAVTFSGSDKPLELSLGKDAAVEGKIYARAKDDKKVYVIPNELKNQISKKADDFRDRKLMDVSATKVNRLTIKKGTDEIELEKKDEHWSLLKPLKARGDDSKVGDLVSQATTIRVDTFVTDAANLTAYGLQEPRGTVSLLSEGGSEPVVLQIGSNPKDEKEKEKTYARLSTREAVVLLPKSIEKLLETKPNDLRDKSLVRVESDIVDRITIEPAGAEKLVLARDKEQWVRKAEKDVPIDSAVATRLLDGLKNQQVASFVSDVATDLPGYGLDQPQVKVTLSSFASENTAETQAGEKPIAAVLFGKVEGENVYAKLDDEPFIVAVPKAVLDSIVTDPLQLQPLAIYKHKPEEITWIEVTKADQPPVTLERDKDQWKLAKGDGSVNQINAQSLVNTLGALHAARWAGAVKPEHGFDKPSLVITFKTSTNTTGKLTLGTVNSEDLTPATAEGFTGTFLVSRPDMEACQLSLLEKPAAPGSTTPMPPGAPATPSPTTRSTVAPPATTPPAAPSATPPAPAPNTPPTPAPEPPAPSPAPADPAAPSSTPPTGTPPPAPSATPPAPVPDAPPTPAPEPTAPPAEPAAPTSPPPSSPPATPEPPQAEPAE